MVRTKADGASCSRKVVSSSAPRKSLGSSSGSSSSSSSSPAGKGNKYAGGNAYCPRPTPEWQKGIGMFLSPGKGKENARPDNDDDIQITGTSHENKKQVLEEAGPSGSGAGPSCSSDD